MTVDPAKRISSEHALQHPWIAADKVPGVPDPESSVGETQNLLPQMKRQFDAKKVRVRLPRTVRPVPESATAQTFRRAIATVRATNRFRQATLTPDEDALMKDVERGQQEAANEGPVDQVLDHQNHPHH